MKRVLYAFNEKELNRWLGENPDAELVDIRMKSGTPGIYAILEIPRNLSTERWPDEELEYFGMEFIDAL